MYSISSDILSRFQRGNKQYARLTYGNNDTIENNRIVQNSFSINRYVVTGESIGIGSTVAAELAFVLRNTDGAFNDVEFLDEEAFVEIGVEDINNTVQYVPFGYYTFVESIANRSTISLTALDRMLKFEKTVGTITFPITVSNLLSAACTDCGVTLDSSVSNLVNGSYSVTSLPDSVKTWREVLQWIGEITGTNAYITRDGKLMLAWFASSSSMSLTTMNRTQSEVGKETISLTGVTILSNDTKYTAGTNTRPLIITDNGLITHDHQSVANAINTARNGYSYSSFSATVLPTPHLDPLDVITFVKGSNNILCPVTDITFKLNGNTELGCKSDQTAHGRSYGLQDATFYAHNIAANSILADKIAAGAITTAKLAAGAVTADKISVSDLQALGATIGGWTITNNALEHYYTDEVNGKQYLLRFISPIYGASTQGIEVLARDYPSGAFENMFAVKYNGKLIAADGDITGKITATSGKIGGWEISSTEIRKENTYVDSDEFTLDSDSMTMRITHPTGGSYHGDAEAQQTEIGEGVVKATHGVIAHGGVFGGYDFATLSGDGLEVHNVEHEWEEPGAKQGVFGYDKLIVANRDILRTHQSLVGGYGTAIAQNTNMNTALDLWKVGRFFCAATATVATLTNCPTPNAFMMECRNVQGTALDGEPYQYMLREIIDLVGDRYIQTGFWSNSSTLAGISSWKKVLTDATFKNGTLTANTGSFSETYCRQAGRVVDIHGWLTGLSTSTQSHSNAITVTGVDLPSVPIRFVFTCWLGNGIAAYAGYGVIDTSGNITFVKAVANSDKVSFQFTYVV